MHFLYNEVEIKKKVSLPFDPHEFLEVFIDKTFIFICNVNINDAL